MALDLSLYLVLDRRLCGRHSMARTTIAAIKGGVGVVQLRDKRADTSGLIETGRVLKAAMAGSGVPLIVNDDLEAALAIDADGLHVGADDTPAQQARRELGPDKILGLSAGTKTAVKALDSATVDYAGIGPIFATATKPDHETPIGWDGLAELVALCPVPAVAIGGLKSVHIPAVRASGAVGIAVVSAICGQPDPERAAMNLARAWKSASSR